LANTDNLAPLSAAPGPRPHPHPGFGVGEGVGTTFDHSFINAWYQPNWTISLWTYKVQTAWLADGHSVVNKQTVSRKVGWTDRQAGRQIDGQLDRQEEIDAQTACKQTGRQTGCNAYSR